LSRLDEETLLLIMIMNVEPWPDQLQQWSNASLASSHNYASFHSSYSTKLFLLHVMFIEIVKVDNTERVYREFKKNVVNVYYGCATRRHFVAFWRLGYFSAF